MAETAPAGVSLNGRPIPTEVELRQDELGAPRFTPRELRMIREHLGRSFTQIITDEDTDDRYAVLAWLKLRRDGFDVDWADMDDVVITFGGIEPPDPTTAPPPTTSPRSAATGE